MTTEWSKIRYLALARAFSFLGTELTIFTLVFREKEQGPIEVALLLIIGTLPMIIFSPLAGTIADRVSTRVAVPIFSVISGFAVLAQTLQLDTWAVFALLFIANTAASVVGPSWQKLLPVLAAPDDLGRAMGTAQTYFSVAGLLGPSIAGLLVKQTGFFWTFFIDGVATLFIALVPFLLNINHKPEELKEGEKTDMAQGFKFLIGNALLRSLVIMIFALVLCISIVNVGDVFLVTDILGADSLIYGLVGTGFAVGMFLMSAFSSSLKIGHKAQLIMVGAGSICMAVCGLLVGVAPNYWVIMGLWFLAGGANAILNTYGVAMMINVVPHEVQGRVFAAFSAITSVASIGSMSMAGFLIDAFGVREIFVIAGALSVLAVLLLFPSVYREQSKIIAASEAEKAIA
ncbi:MAG: hypothetical protein RL719_228 [Actinomycetota bacterium]